MDPVGPWYASYNRLAAGSAAGTFQGSGSGSSGGDFPSHHLTSGGTQSIPSTTTSQLLLQAAHTTASLAGQPSPFNPGGFLSPPPVGYDVFAPLFHHPNTKQAHYVAQHRQALAQVQQQQQQQQQSVSSTKQTTTPEPEVAPLRENYSAAHQQQQQQQQAAFFESQASSPTASSLAWSHQNNSQLPSPFGILPHESVVPSSPGPPSTKSSGSYENTFNPHFPNAGQSINNINPQQLSNNAVPTVAGDFKSTNYESGKKPSSVVRVTSTAVVASAKIAVSTSPAATGAGQTFFQQVPTTFGLDTLNTNRYATANDNQTPNTKVSGALHQQQQQQQQQTCIVSSSNNAAKEYRIPQPPVAATRSVAATTIFLNTSIRAPSTQVEETKNTRNFVSSTGKTGSTVQSVQTKAQTKIYPELGTHVEVRRADTVHENSQSSPISFSMMDSRNMNYQGNAGSNCSNNGNGKMSNNPRTTPTGNLQPQLTQQQQQQFHVLNQQQQTTSYRHYSTGSQSDSEYHHSGRSKSATSTDSAYSSNNSTQNGPDCGGVVVPRRPSPLQAHSQPSPLGHVPSPAYPMYNSPMNSMSSPSPLQQHNENNGNNHCGTGASYKTTVVQQQQQQQQQQVTPPSPLDVTVPRPSSQGQVAYSSVITRVLGSADNAKSNYNSPENRTYDRQQEFNQKQQQQVCWETENRQNNVTRKFPQTTYATTTTDINPQSLPAQQQPQRVLNITERQQAYFDSTQVTLQDLSSCRGDPMSIVKNLQGSCQIQQQQQQQQQVANTVSVEQQKQAEERQRKATAETPNKKKRNYDKTGHSSLNDLAGAAAMTEYISRIPPPAHHNSNQQTQNGYFDFERWNPLAQPPAKIFSGTSTSFTSQTAIHHSGNFTGNTAHQSIMVPHHHAPPPIPYFPAFHIAPNHHSHHSHDYQSPVEVTPVAFNENSTAQNSCYQEFRDDQPKVIVPNIEEELGFLQQLPPPSGNQMNREIKRTGGQDPNSGFMTSYLKFLQGDREPSPPPVRGGRRATWNKGSKPYVPTPPKKINETTINGDTSVKTVNEKPTTTKDTPVIDYANDPRYFPLPKERKTLSFDSSDDGFTSDDDFPFSTHKKSEKKGCNTNTGIFESVKIDVQPKPRKGRPPKPGGITDRKRKKAAAAAAAGIEVSKKGSKKSEQGALLSLPPRRETSKRKAKEKTSVKHLLDASDNEEEQVDSDSDPAWTPAAKLVGEEEEKKKKRGRPVISKKSKRLLDEDGYSSGDVIVLKKFGRKKQEGSSKNSNNAGKASCKIDEKLLATVSDEDIDISPFKSGEFVVIKADLEEEFPALWRIDGKTLLQKYEPFKSNGKTLYRNISTYSGWAPQNRHIYQQVPVKFWQQGKIETVVEFLREEMIIDDSECIDRSMKDTEKYQDNFEVYIQTLISQALDSNFLTEIFQEQDDYFLSNVKTVDEITDERKRRLLSTTKWQTNTVTAISTWPCLNIVTELVAADSKGKQCAGCQQNKVHARIQLYGQPYNATTLEASTVDPRVPQDKDFLLCRVCQAKLGLYNKVAHQKYLMYVECARRVADKRIADPHKDTTIILNELLADEAWLNQLFKEVRGIWAEIDSIEQQTRAKLSPNTGTVKPGVSNPGKMVVESSRSKNPSIAEISDSFVPPHRASIDDCENSTTSSTGATEISNATS